MLELEPPAPDDDVLVPSAAGGLGRLLVQPALTAGADRGRRRERQPHRGPGPDRGWTGRRLHRARLAERVRSTVGGVSLLYDCVGGEVGRATLELLRPGGRLVMFGWSAGAPTQVDTGDLVRLGTSARWSLGARMLALPGGIPGLAARALERVATGAWSPLVSTYL